MTLVTRGFRDARGGVAVLHTTEHGLTKTARTMQVPPHKEHYVLGHLT